MAVEEQPVTGISTSRVSRYRSQRAKPSALASAPPPSVPVLPSPELNTIQRSRSRYHHAKPVVITSAVPAIPVSATLKGSDTNAHPAVSRKGQASLPQIPTKRTLNASVQPLTARALNDQYAMPHRARNLGNSLVTLPAEQTSTGLDSQEEDGRVEARHILEQEAERQRKLRLRIRADRERAKARKDAEIEQSTSARTADHTVRRGEDMQGRPEPQLEEARKQTEGDTDYKHCQDGHCTARNFSLDKKSNECMPSDVGAPTDLEMTDASLQTSPSKELLGFMRRKRGNDTSNMETSAATSGRRRGSQQLHTDTLGAGPGVDTPMSAVNAGERRVLVEAHRSSINLTVTPTTTSADLINAAASRLTTPINANASVLLENFAKAGLNRPLRLYESVRRVMNSWDDDRQNSLILVPSAANGNDPDLSLSSVPASQPPEFTCQMYHSQKVGKWEKKHVTLRSDGQLTVNKKPGGTNETEQINVCHMTDFDIYSPNPKQISRKIKPPKKLCFAIKSQQKIGMFLSREDFVHFFCCGDKRTAAGFYRAVQGWRSWYLANVLGEGQVVQEKTSAVGTGPTAPRRSGTLNRGTTLRRPSKEGSPAPTRQHTSRTQNPPSAYRPQNLNTTSPPTRSSQDTSAPIPTTTNLNRNSSSAGRPQTQPRPQPPAQSSPPSQTLLDLPLRPTHFKGRGYHPRASILGPDGHLITVATGLGPRPRPSSANDTPPPLPTQNGLLARKPTVRQHDPGVGLMTKDFGRNEGFVAGGLVGLIPERNGTVVDRSRGREVRVGTGEGV